MDDRDASAEKIPVHIYMFCELEHRFIDSLTYSGVDSTVTAYMLDRTLFIATTMDHADWSAVLRVPTDGTLDDATRLMGRRLYDYIHGCSDFDKVTKVGTIGDRPDPVSDDRRHSPPIVRTSRLVPGKSSDTAVCHNLVAFRLDRKNPISDDGRDGYPTWSKGLRAPLRDYIRHYLMNIESSGYKEATDPESFLSKRVNYIYNLSRRTVDKSAIFMIPPSPVYATYCAPEEFIKLCSPSFDCAPEIFGISMAPPTPASSLSGESVSMEVGELSWTFGSTATSDARGISDPPIPLWTLDESADGWPTGYAGWAGYSKDAARWKYPTHWPSPPAAASAIFDFMGDLKGDACVVVHPLKSSESSKEAVALGETMVELDEIMKNSSDADEVRITPVHADILESLLDTSDLTETQTRAVKDVIRYLKKTLD